MSIKLLQRYVRKKKKEVLEFKGKTIIFGAPTAFGFSDAIKQELERVGLTVYDFSPLPDVEFRYKSIWQRLHNVYRKVIHNDYENKKKLRAKATEDLLIRALEEVPKVDFSFFIRPDLFSKSFIKEVRHKSKLSVAYQWDGLSRYPEVYDYINHFDRFFVFDPEDVSEKTFLLTNFFLPHADNKKSTYTSNVAYSISSYEKSRVLETGVIGLALNKLGLDLDFTVMCYADKTAEDDVNKDLFKVINSHVTYEENLENVKRSAILVDIQAKFHDGLSFRVFEALHYGKKLITTNSSVKNYDFYESANIFVWDGHNQDNLRSFLDEPLKNVPNSIKSKYSFDNWIRYVLDVEPYENILLNNAVKLHHVT